MIYSSAASIHVDCVVLLGVLDEYACRVLGVYPLAGPRLVIAAPSALRDENRCIIRARDIV